MKKLAFILLSLLLMFTPAIAQVSDAAATGQAQTPPPAVKAKSKTKDKAKDTAKDNKTKTAKDKGKAKAVQKPADPEDPEDTADAANADKKSDAKAQPPAKVEPKGPFIMIDARSGEVLMEGRSGEPYYPASLTKLMTSYIIFQKLRAGLMKPDQQLTVSELANSQEPSKIGVPVGKTVSVDFALQALLVYSANDMAYVLAEGADGSIAAFADEMNANAKRLGLTASHFQNPNGLFDPRHVSSARDLAVLAAVIINEFPEYQKYFIQPFVEVGKKRLPNRNILIRTMPEADGMKTGFVCASGFNLVASATRNGRRLIAVVMGMKNSAARAAAARAMLEEGFDMPPAPRRKVADVPNLPQGAIVPVDMTGTVCRSKPLVTVQDGAELAGWAASFGTYDSADKAQMALRGRALSPAGLTAGGKAGVIELPDNSGYSPVIWGLDQGKSATVCAQYKQDGAHCDVLPAVLMDKIAMVAKAKKAAEAAQTSIEQGADSEQKPVRRIGH